MRALISVLTIGHSTRSAGELVEMLRGNLVTSLWDIRTIPRSRTNPQFNRENLPDTLRAAGMTYRHFPDLGGLRRPRDSEENAGWRNKSFRGYADYMQTPAFLAAIDELLEKARSDLIALMCAEAVPWRCHRSLVADALLVRGVDCQEIVSPHRRKLHRLTPFASVQGVRVTYPPVETNGEAAETVRASLR